MADNGEKIKEKQGQDVPATPKPKTFCVITDANGVVQDITTRKENLSRGYSFAGYHEYVDIPVIPDLRIDDTFDGVNVTPNLGKRAKDAEYAAQQEKSISV